MQHEKTINRTIITKADISDLRQMEISPCGTFHMLGGKPLYKERFLKVGKFHKPGFAPVHDNNGAYHIKIDGKAVYQQRFQNAFGFYCSMAAIEDNDNSFYHIKPDGERAYNNFFDWAGNYQENLCVVKKDGHFFHINKDGNKIYTEKYNYVGDFKDKIAVVHQNGKATHINDKGRHLHGKWFKDLGIFHKGFAIAQDESGWFHLNIQGMPAYSERFKNVEPFYNELAKVETFDGVLQQIDINGKVESILAYPEEYFTTHQISSQLAGFWNTFLIKAAAELNLFNLLPGKLIELSNKLNVPAANLIRLLKSLWEIAITEYDQTTSLWDLSYKGKCIKESSFLSTAAIMWAEVARQKGWEKLIEILKEPEIASFPSFKERESDRAKQELFYKALIGYSKFDTTNFSNIVNIPDKTNIILLGAHSLGLIENLKTNYNLTFTYLNTPQLPMSLIEIYTNISFKLSDDLTGNYDIALLCRFLSHFDDNAVLQYLAILERLKIGRLLIIETLTNDHSPLGGIIDINTMIESGGKLRTKQDWQILISRKNYQIKRINNINTYLSVIDGQW